MRLIDADELLEWIDAAENASSCFTSIRIENIRYMINSRKTINPEDLRPKGKWENYPSHYYRRCSVCKVEFEKPRFNIRAKFCPNCGAEME